MTDQDRFNILALQVSALNAAVHVLLRHAASVEVRQVLAVKFSEQDAHVVASGLPDAVLEQVQALHATLLAACDRPPP